MRVGRAASGHRRGAAVLAALLLVVGITTIATAPPAAAAVLSVDVLVTTHGTAATSVSSPTFTTAQAGELLVAFVTADGPERGERADLLEPHRRQPHVAPAAAHERPRRHIGDLDRRRAERPHERDGACDPLGHLRRVDHGGVLHRGQHRHRWRGRHRQRRHGCAVRLADHHPGRFVGLGRRQRLGPGPDPHGRGRPDEGRRVPRLGRGHLLGAAADGDDGRSRHRGHGQRHRPDERPLEPVADRDPDRGARHHRPDGAGQPGGAGRRAEPGQPVMVGQHGRHRGPGLQGVPRRDADHLHDEHHLHRHHGQPGVDLHLHGPLLRPHRQHVGRLEQRHRHHARARHPGADDLRGHRHVDHPDLCDGHVGNR